MHLPLTVHDLSFHLSTDSLVTLDGSRDDECGPRPVTIILCQTVRRDFPSLERKGPSIGFLYGIVAPRVRFLLLCDPVSAHGPIPGGQGVMYARSSLNVSVRHHGAEIANDFESSLGRSPFYGTTDVA